MQKHFFIAYKNPNTCIFLSYFVSSVNEMASLSKQQTHKIKIYNIATEYDHSERDSVAILTKGSRDSLDLPKKRVDS